MSNFTSRSKKGNFFIMDDFKDRKVKEKTVNSSNKTSGVCLNRVPRGIFVCSLKKRGEKEKGIWLVQTSQLVLQNGTNFSFHFLKAGKTAGRIYISELPRPDVFTDDGGARASRRHLKCGIDI